MSEISKKSKRCLLIETGNENDIAYEQIVIHKNEDGSKIDIVTTFDGTCSSNYFELTREQIALLLEFFKHEAR